MAPHPTTKMFCLALTPLAWVYLEGQGDVVSRLINNCNSSELYSNPFLWSCNPKLHVNRQASPCFSPRKEHGLLEPKCSTNPQKLHVPTPSSCVHVGMGPKVRNTFLLCTFDALTASNCTVSTIPMNNPLTATRASSLDDELENPKPLKKGTTFRARGPVVSR